LKWKQVASRYLKAGVIALFVSLPIVLWNIGAFWHSAVQVQMIAPFRPDALSFLAAADQFGINIARSAGWSVLAAAIATGLVLWRSPRNIAGFCVGVALVFFCFFAFNKQAFANYYFFVFAAMCCGIAAIPLQNSRCNELAPSECI
jgi:hypothetical protein